MELSLPSPLTDFFWPSTLYRIRGKKRLFFLSILFRRLLVAGFFTQHTQ